MDKPLLHRTGSHILCSPPDWTQMPDEWPIRSDFEHQCDVIDAPEALPCGGVRVVEIRGCPPYQSQYSRRADY